MSSPARIRDVSFLAPRAHKTNRSVLGRCGKWDHLSAWSKMYQSPPSARAEGYPATTTENVHQNSLPPCTKVGVQMDSCWVPEPSPMPSSSHCLPTAPDLHCTAQRSRSAFDSSVCGTKGSLISPGLYHHKAYINREHSECANVFSSNRLTSKDCQIRAMNWTQNHNA